MVKLSDHPVAVVKNDYRTMVVGDLHIGLGKLPVEFCVEELISCTEKVSPDNIVILGDLKHGIGIRRRELAVIKEMIETLREMVDNIFILQGNHDGGLREEFEMVGPRGFVFDGTGYFHGHALPVEDVWKADRIFTAHTHPTVILKDEVGSVRLRVWVEGKAGGREVTVLPAFNPLCRGSVLNRSREEWIGVLFRKKLMDTTSAKIYSLDGTYLGKLGMLGYAESEDS